MTKAVPYILGSVFILGLTVVMLKQNGIIGKQDKTIKVQAEQILELDQKFTKEESAKLSAIAENSVLIDVVEELKTENQQLIKENADLKKKIKSQDKIIKGFQTKLNQAKIQYADLNERIKTLQVLDDANQAEINALLDQKKLAAQSLNEITIEKKKQEKEKVQNEKLLMEQQIQARKNERIRDIVENTVVHFKSVSAHKDQYGKSIGKLKSKKNNWYYTNFTFDLMHPDQSLLLDELFIIKIVDKNTHKVLSYVEANPNFPESNIDTKGVLFKYAGDNTELKYYNNELKAGENFEVQLLYVTEDGREHLLANGSRQFIENRKVLKF